MNITIARLRSNVKYNGPLKTVLDSFFENYVKWMKDNPQHEYKTYNVSFDNTRPKRTPETIEWADVIIIPSDSEFRYHGKVPQINPKDLARSEEHMDNIRPYFKNKHVIVWQSDRADTEDLYRNETLKNIELKSFNSIDELDFSANIHGMKYHFIQTLKSPLFGDVINKTSDFAYWGKMRGVDLTETDNISLETKRLIGTERGKLIRQIYRSDLSTVLVGGFPSGIVRQSKWIKDWHILYPMLEPCRSTLCFNWLDPTATSARYAEALAMNIVPFVWKEYDKNNTYNIEDWQRVASFEDFYEKVLQLRDNTFFESRIESYKNNFKQILLSEDEYLKEFSDKMNVCIKENIK